MNHKLPIKPSEYGVTSCHIQGVNLELHSFGAMYWKGDNSLFVSDTHFGKVSHFRKNGIAVPSGAIQQNWDRLTYLIDHYKPDELVFLGDLFHSSHNNEWDTLQAISDTFYDLKLLLVEGNHDILDPQVYVEANIQLRETLIKGPFLFSHHPYETTEYFNIHGHIHPAVKLRGRGRQSIKISCFYFGQHYGIMPAFGNFTGTAIIPIKEGDQVFGLAGTSVIKL